MNWGKSIVLCFVLFATFVGIMSYKMASAKIDLVQKDYYQKELDYQIHINRVANSASFKKEKTMTYLPDKQVLQIEFPTPVRQGKITFFRPSDKSLDFTVPIHKKSLIKYSTANLKKGTWKVQIAWSDGALDYYLEDQFFNQ